MSLRAFLIADIRGYTKYTHERGDEAAARMTSRFFEIARDQVAAHSGEVIEQRGDEVLAVFESPRNAIKAAVDVQARLLEATLADPEVPLAAGIGIDVGEAVEVEGGLRSGAINLAARLCSQAGPGEIYATQELVHMARALEGVEYLARAAVRLKGLEQPIQPVKVAAEMDPANLWAAMPVTNKAAPSTSAASRSRRTALIAGSALALVALAGIAFALTREESGDPRGGDRDSQRGNAIAASGPMVGDCPVFPADNPWNLPVDQLPLHPDSDRLITSIGAKDNLHPDFGPRYRGDEIGIPVSYVDGDVTGVPVVFRYADESDPGPYPLSEETRLEGGSDRHAVIVDRSGCKLFELLNVRGSGGTWRADSGAIFDLTSNELRPLGWTSADAAGLPIFPGLARYDEVAAGAIEHALRFTVEETREAYVYPARHEASDSDDRDLPPMGMRVRLKSDFPVADYPPQAQVILEALQKYGMMLADNGGDWFITGEPNEEWVQAELDSLKQLRGSDFEVVDTSSFAPSD